MMIKENKGCGDNGGISEVNPSNAITPYLCDDIVNDILSRLPVKSLMRFKLVCKHWKNSIQNDLYFMNLHLTNSRDPGVMDLIFKTSTKPISPGSRGSDLCLANVCRTNNKPVVAARHRYKSLYNTPEFWRIFMRPLNGLICFVRKNEGYIRVANITTGEETPWIKATLKDDYYGINFSRFKCDWWTGFGYDPARKQHKVICIYEKHYLDAQRKDVGEVEEVCEVMTLGGGGGNYSKNNYTWRRIDDYPQYRIRYFDECVCVKGSIYWVSRGHVPTSRGKWKNSITDCKTITELFYEGMSLVAFDVGREKFRTIAIPQDIIYSPEAEEDPFMQDRDITLLEVSGHIALVDREIKKLWLFMDDYDGDMMKKTNTTNSSSGCGNWIRETICIKLPLIDESYIRFDDGVPGTDEILVKIKDVNWKDHFYICYYNWKKKTVGNIIEIATSENKYINHYGQKVRIFTQSLLSV